MILKPLTGSVARPPVLSPLSRSVPSGSATSTGAPAKFMTKAMSPRRVACTPEGRLDTTGVKHSSETSAL